MNYKDLEIGTIYCCDYNVSWQYIFRENKTNSNALVVTNKTYTEGKSDFSGMHTFRGPSRQEIEHFLQCEKARKYVEYKPELIEYSIY